MENSAAMPLPNDDMGQTANPKIGNNRAEIRWEIVARTPGITPAHIIVGRLQAEGIPARAWQESAGQAYGFTVGLLGTGYVSVPEEFVAAALDVLEAQDEAELDEAEFFEDEEFNDF